MYSRLYANFPKDVVFSRHIKAAFQHLSYTVNKILHTYNSTLFRLATNVEKKE